MEKQYKLPDRKKRVAYEEKDSLCLTSYLIGKK